MRICEIFLLPPGLLRFPASRTAFRGNYPTASPGVKSIRAPPNPFVALGSGVMWRRWIGASRSPASRDHAALSFCYRNSSIVTLFSERRISPLALNLYRGSAAFLVIYGLGSAISFGVHLLMARLLGAKSYGYFVYATSWMAILLLGCNIGLKP